MTLTNFVLMNDVQKEHAVRNDGKFLLSLNNNGRIIDMYIFESFYAALFYDSQPGANVKVKACQSPEELLHSFKS